MLLGTGCTPPPEPVITEPVIRCGTVSIERDEFLEELDLKLSAYPYDINEQPILYNEMIMDLVHALTEQCQLLNAAARLGIQVSDQELDQAEKNLRQDYPENSFEQILMENALSYEFWKRKLKQTLIIDKLIQIELKEKIEITADELLSFYEKISNEYPDSKSGSGPENAADIGTELVDRLRREKSQSRYNEWIQKLKLDFPAEIDQNAVKEFFIHTDNDKGQINE